MLARLAGAARDLEALVMPRACLGCERAMPAADPGVCCALCRHRMRAIAPPACARCGQPLDPWQLRLGAAGVARRRGGPARAADRRGGAPGRAGREACAFCREWPAELRWAASAVWMDDGPARNLVHALKYTGWRAAAEPMAERIMAAAGPLLRSCEVLVPVPLGRARLRERGHNQAELLARAVARRTGQAVRPQALRRARETRSQTRLGPSQRWRNVAGAFVAAAPELAGRRVALVDDVLTTGATLASAAQALAGLGPAEIGAVTFARALQPT